MNKQPMKKLFLWLIALFGVLNAQAQEYTLAQFMNVRSASKPTFSSNSYEIAFVTNLTGEPQVWRTFLWPAPHYQVTFEAEGADGVWWSPGKQELMVISASKGGNEKSQLYMINPYGSPWFPLTHDSTAVNNFGKWANDGSRFSYASNERNKTDFDIYEIEIATEKPTLLYSASGYHSAGGYSPDNRYLLITRFNSNVDSDILVYDRETNQVMVMTGHDGTVLNSNPQWDSTGTGFYYISNQDREFSGLAYRSLNNDSVQWIETPDWDVENLAVAPNGQSICWTVNVKGYSEFNYRNLVTDQRVGSYRVPKGVIQGLQYSPDGTKIAITFGSGNTPVDIWTYEPDPDQLKQVTFSAVGGIPIREMREPQLIEYETFDGKKIPAFWYTPANPAKKMPVVIMVHGGPESQARPDLSGFMQYLLYKGYAVLEPNVRGSAGYGKTYLDLDNVQKRMDSVQDLEYAARWLEKQPNVDKTRIALMGGSYGGFMTLSGLTTYPDRWAAGVSLVGIANFVTFLENTSSYRRALREAEYGSLENDREFLASVSPLTHVDKIKAPLFLIQGANDPRVPQSEADQMAQAIRNRGGIVEYLLFEDEGHGIRKIENKLKAYFEVAKFLDFYVKNR